MGPTEHMTVSGPQSVVHNGKEKGELLVWSASQQPRPALRCFPALPQSSKPPSFLEWKPEVNNLTRISWVIAGGAGLPTQDTLIPESLLPGARLMSHDGCWLPRESESRHSAERPF